MSRFSITFIRNSDNESLTFEDGVRSGFALKKGVKILDNAAITTASYQYANLDGGYAVNQKRQPLQFNIDGYVFPRFPGETTWELRKSALMFFKIRENYTVVFQPCDTEPFALKNVIVTDGAHIREQFYAGFAEFNSSFMALDPRVYRWTGGGYSSSAVLPRSLDIEMGGRMWGENGAIWVAGEKTWEESGVNVIELDIDTVSDVSPVITIEGSAVNPRILNLSTNSVLEYDGTVAEGQTLVIDCENRTAKLSGANVVDALSGNWIVLKDGINRMQYSADSGTSTEALLEWNEVIG